MDLLIIYCILSTMIKKYLEYFGFSDKEALIYVTLLRADNLSAHELMHVTGISKSTLYLAIETLKHRDFVREINLGKKVVFEAQSPDRLMDYIQSEKSRIADQEKRIVETIMELKTLDRLPREKPEVRFFEGKEGVKESVREFTSTEYFSERLDYGIYTYDLMDKIFSERDIEKFDEKRIEKNLRFKAIYSGVQKEIPRSKMQEAVKIDQNQFPIECDIGIFNDEVRFHTLGKNIWGVTIKNQEIATTLKSLIEYIFSMHQNR